MAAADLTSHECGGAGFDPASGRLFLSLHAGQEVLIQAREPGDKGGWGTAAWEQTLPGKPTGKPATFAVSPAGDRVAVAQPATFEVGVPVGPNQPPQMRREERCGLAVFDAKTGKPGPDLAGPTFAHTSGLTFSADGRLLFAQGQLLNDPDTRVAVWDTKTGAEVKVWVRPQPVLAAAFAPTGHELLVAEEDGRTLLGVWDLAPLVK